MKARAVSTEQAILLFAHGSRDPDWARPVEALRDRIVTLAGARVDIAYLEYRAPTLPEAVTRMAAEGVCHAYIIPVFIGQGAHLRRDLPALVESARLMQPDIRLQLLPALGAQPEILEAIARVLAAQIPDQAACEPDQD
jgi:sirohydrochlorin cobaltochelatase